MESHEEQSGNQIATVVRSDWNLEHGWRINSCSSEKNCRLVCLAMLSDILFMYLYIPSLEASLSILIPYGRLPWPLTRSFSYATTDWICSMTGKHANIKEMTSRHLLFSSVDGGRLWCWCATINLANTHAHEIVQLGPIHDEPRMQPML